jgi:hypothetical protein
MQSDTTQPGRSAARLSRLCLARGSRVACEGLEPLPGTRATAVSGNDHARHAAGFRGEGLIRFVTADHLVSDLQ